MIAITEITVNHPAGQYKIHVGQNVLAHLYELAPIEGPVALITDSHVGPLLAEKCGPAACHINIPAGETHKTLETVNGIYSKLLAAGLDRKGTIVALGGGVVGDMAGFVAATFMRGIGFVQCPTSLLAMVDASVGGKTGVDLPQGKNLVGAFKQPTAVLADISALQSLPQQEFANGMAEVIKHGLISSPDLFTQIEREGARLQTASPARLQSLVSEAIIIKRDVVQEDPYEHGRRALLNLGHTFGHAIEQVSHYRVSHGQGVALGLVAAANLSIRLEYCDPSLQGRIEAVLTQVNLPTRIPADISLADVYQMMFSDKKKAENTLRFILLKDVGDVFITDRVPQQMVMATMTAVQAVE